MTPTTEQQIPQDNQSEKALLSCLCQDHGLIYEITVNLFWNAANRIIFEAVERLGKNSKVKTLDFQVLKTEVGRSGQLEDCGGIEYLNEIWGFCPAPSAWAYYRDSLESCRLHREAVIAAMQILKAESSEEAQKAVADLSKSSAMVTGSIRPIKSLLFDTIDWMERNAQRRSRPFVKFGIRELDNMVWIEPGNQIVISANTGGGKTALATQAVVQSTGTSWAIFSMEMQGEAIAERMIANGGPVSLGGLRSGKLQPWEHNNMDSAITKLRERKIWVEDRATTVEKIASTCRSLQLAHGLDAIVVDYLQLIVPSGKAPDSRQEQVAQISRALKLLASELKIAVLTMSQLNDDGRLRESRAIGHDADVVLRISEEKDGQAIWIDKHRNGARGKVSVNFNGQYVRFE